MINFLVVGYFDHNNHGDEQYKLSMKRLLQIVFTPTHKIQVQFINCDRIQEIYIPPHTVVILGGGDVLNNYFLDKLQQRLRPPYTNPILAISVGIPYNDVITDQEMRSKLDVFDAIFLRTRQDLPLFSSIVPADTEQNSWHVHYLPDTSCLLLEDLLPLRPKLSFLGILHHAIHSNRKIIGISLCRHIYNQDKVYRDNYNKIVYEFAFLIYHLVKEGYYVILMPFNTKTEPAVPSLNKENDILIQEDVWKLLSPTTRNNVTNINFEMTTDEMMTIYSKLYICIPMRFHATCFSIYNNVPMIPIYTTKKIKNLLLDIDWKYQMPLEKNSWDLPTKFDRKQFLKTFRELTKNYDSAVLKLQHANEVFQQSIKSQYGTIRNVVLEKLKQLPADGPLSLDNIQLTAEGDGDGTQDNVETTIQILYNKLQEFAMENQVDDFRNLTSPELQNVAVCVVSYYLTKSIDSVYNHGLMMKMFHPNYDCKSEWGWVMRHHIESTLKDDSLTKNYQLRHLPHSESAKLIPSNITFNMEYIDQNDRSGVHRSGWKYVYDHLKPYHDQSSNLLVDLYVDRTFHWKRNIYKYIGILPYQQPWVGVIHHTFDTTFSEYNNVVLLKNPDFQKSLEHCRALIVLSRTLQKQLLKELRNLSLQYPLTKPIPVYCLNHPTELKVKEFDYQEFLKNNEKCLLHVGGWLRNIFSFYQIELAESYRFYNPLLSKTKPSKSRHKTSPAPGSCSCTSWKCFSFLRKPTHDMVRSQTKPEPTGTIGTLRKFAIKGKYMSNYFPLPNYQDPSDILMDVNNPNNSALCSRGGEIQNNWYKHLIEYTKKIQTNTNVMEYVPNDVYDVLLTKNVVFLHLVDGAAINTVIECFVRNTPMIVNRHPAVVEILGEDYPLYYDIKENGTQPTPSVHEMLSNMTSIWDAHKYLSGMDKKRFQIEHFLTKFLDIIKTIE
jgi:Polysaccharide pyruvyl transferase